MERQQAVSYFFPFCLFGWTDNFCVIPGVVIGHFLICDDCSRDLHLIADITDRRFRAVRLDTVYDVTVAHLLLPASLSVLRLFILTPAFYFLDMQIRSCVPYAIPPPNKNSTRKRMPVDGFILLQSAACVKSQAVTVVETITEPSEQFHMVHDSELKGLSRITKRGLQAPFGDHAEPNRVQVN